MLLLIFCKHLQLLGSLVQLVSVDCYSIQFGYCSKMKDVIYANICSLNKENQTPTI